jgi:hypothetical protein
MRIVSFCAVALSCLVLLSGCHTAPPEIPFDKAAATRVKSIGIIVSQFPEQPVALLATSIGQNLGLLGALVDAGMNSSRVSKVEAMLKSQGFVADSYFIAKLKETLEAEGYKVFIVSQKRGKGEFAKAYPVNSYPRVDAYLDIVVGSYGYLAAGIGDDAPYRPTFNAHVKLVSSIGNSVLMQDIVAYNIPNKPENIVTLSPDPEMKWVDFDTLMADPVRAVSGLRAAEEQTASMLGKLAH